MSDIIGEPYPLDGGFMEGQLVEGEEAVATAMQEAEDAFQANISLGADVIKDMLRRLPGADEHPGLADRAVDRLVERCKDLGGLEQMRRTIGQITRGEPLVMQTGVPGEPDEDI